MTIDYSKQTFIVNGVDDFEFSTALRLWKTKYETDFRDFEREVTYHPSLYEFRDLVKEMWDDIVPVTVEEALKEKNVERRRVYFDCIGVEKLFKQLDPTLKDRQVIKKKRTRWDSNNDPYEYEFEDVYELYEIEGTKLFEKNQRNQSPDPVFAVRCWCTTTNREYWLYVPRRAAAGNSWASSYNVDEWDAIRSIAWTIRIDAKHPERIYRQGDIIVVKKSSDAVVSPYHLTKEQYLQLMYSET